MLLSPYHAGGQLPLAGILDSSAARGTCAVERFAGAHPSHFVGPFRLQGRGWPCLSTAHVPRALFCTKFSTQPIHHHATIHVTQASRTQNSRRDLLSTGADESDLQTRPCRLSVTARAGHLFTDEGSYNLENFFYRVGMTIIKGVAPCRVSRFATELNVIL